MTHENALPASGLLAAGRPREVSATVAKAVTPVASRCGRLVMQGISKRFQKSDGAALEDVSITCAPGEFVVVVGPSGCGKSTLLNIAAGMIAPDSGAATLDGQPITGPGPDRAMVFQDHGLFPWLTAAQNVGFGLKMTGASNGDHDARVAEALRKVHLGNAGQKLVHELSGGMRQRIAIARALVMDPAVLLMDEPFASLDAQTRTLLHHHLQQLWVETHKTVLFVTHSVGEAVRLADRIIVLHSHPGRIRKIVNVQLPHPRKFDSPDINELARLVRREIENEVNRVNALNALNPLNATPEETEALAPVPADLGDYADDLGGNI